MRRKISLYIANRLVDLDDQSLILFNYTMEDLLNPTIVRNSYSHQVTLKGTPNNNKIFGDIFRSDRVTEYGTEKTGIYFDPARKTDFVIYNEMSEVLESGYCKLDNITRRHNSVEYTITLYGGLGSFFYSLSYDAEGNKRTLADLDFVRGGDDELDFTITKDAIKNAWSNLIRPVFTLWDIINFIPAYNGLPGGSFDADKALVNIQRAGLATPDGYAGTNGYALCKLPRKYTEWEVKDLRSYLQRPVIKFSRIMDAICNPNNNGGYSVNLDEDFFNDTNPYYKDLWLTLPIVNQLELDINEGSGTFSPGTGDTTIPEGGIANANYRININILPTISLTSGGGVPVYMHCNETWEDGEVTRDGYYMTFSRYRAVVFDSQGNELERQDVYISSRQTPTTTIAPNIDIIGHFDADGEWTGDPINFSFEAQGIASVRLQVLTDKASWGTPSIPDVNARWVWTDVTDVNSLHLSNHSLVNDSSTYAYSTSESARTGSVITKKDLLSSDKTPADYLLSYCKTFGLVFMCDKGQKVISIMKKSSFYQDNIIDLTKRVNIDSDINIIPFAFNSKWYQFSQPSEGEFADYYRNIYDQEFGSQRVNTGYDFNADTKELMDNILFSGACEVLENSKFFQDLTYNNRVIPTLFLDKGGVYTLTKKGETKEFDLPSPPVGATKVWWNNTDKSYDFFPKLQFHQSEENPVDVRDSFVFFTGMVDVSSGHIAVTDDNPLMMSLNNNTPCWFLNDTDIVTYLPRFSRYTRTGNTITRSLDFGTPQEVMIPNATFGANSSIYDRYWKNYISDRYDDDSKVMTCKVNLSGFQVDQAFLRNIFYFDGALWALNRVMNHSLTTWDDTECEFVKIQDKNNYIG